MTLCIARRTSKTNIELASDSRISIGTRHFDTGIKVFAIPVSISWPIFVDENGDNEPEKAKYTLGLAVAGDTLHAYLVKEAISEILQNLQYIPGHTDLSLDKLCEIINKVFTQLAQDIDGAREIYLKSGFFLTGYCIEQQQLRAFRFETDRSPYGIGGKYYEILKDCPIEFIGSGEDLGKEIYKQHPNWRTLWILDEAIRRNEVVSVGGKLQYGCFHDKFEFYISGIVDYDANEDNVQIGKMFLRGVDLYKEAFITDNFSYWVSYQYLDPFNPSIIDKWNNRNPNDKFERIGR